MIRTMFEERYGPKQVVAVKTARRTENIGLLTRKIEICQQNIEYYRIENEFNPRKRHTIKTGKIFKKSIDAELYFIKKLKKAQAELKFVQNLENNKNAGIAFVSFRDKDCVIQTIDEIDIAKLKLAEEEAAVRLKLDEWTVEEGIPPSDIIWADLN